MTIEWRSDANAALAEEAKAGSKPVLLDFSAAPMWAGCARLEAEVYSDKRVARMITDNFLPVRVHVREQAEDFRRLGERFGAQWTPTILLLDPAGTERHRIEGFLPADDFMAQLGLGLGRIHFFAGRFDEAERQFREVVERHAGSDAAAEALYWAGVSKYKRTNDGSALAETERAFRDAYQETPWAKKASVWRG